MRNLVSILIALVGVAGVTTVAGAQAAGPKWAYIDTQRLIAEAPGAREAQATLQQEMQRHQAELQARQDSVQKLIADFQQQSVMLSPDARKKKEEEIVEKQRQLEQRVNEVEEQMVRRQRELLEPIMNRVRQAVEAVRAEEGYAMIINREALVAADPALDLTDKVLARVRAMASAGSGGSTSAGAAAQSNR
ncbi:MAG TPA: OmpH family outer membrane protein [Longimicrobiales bacterium]